MAVTGIEGLLGSLGAEPAAPTRRNDELNRTDFLNLLIAQLQNQDPLNPMESADFSAQLAQFSSLEQLMQINQKLGDKAAPTDPTATLGALGFLGQEVGFASDELTVVEGAVPTFDLALDAPADVSVEIVDEAGRAVGTVALGRVASGRTTVDLASLPDAPDLPDGRYTLRVAAIEDGGVTAELAPIFRARVDGVELAGGTPVLLVGNRRLGVADVLEIRAAAPSAPAATPEDTAGA